MPASLAWTGPARRVLRRLPEKVATAVIELCYGPLADNPRRVSKPLRLDMAGLHSARRGDFRIIYRIDEATRVTILAIEHRSDAYRNR